MTTIESYEKSAEPAPAATDQLYHALRSADGRWQGPFELIGPSDGEHPAGFVGATCTEVAGELMLIAVGTDGELYLTTRDRDGSWEPFLALRRGDVYGGPKQFYAATCAATRGELQLVGLGSTGRLYHTIRAADGSWQDHFELIDAEAHGGPDAFAAVSCTSIGDSLHVVVLDASGQLHHTIRSANGAWQEFRGLARGELYDAPARFVAIDCAAAWGGSLQVVGVGSDAQLYHTIRWPDGTWQRYFGVLGGQRYGGAPQFALSVGCARVGDALGLVAIDSGNRLFHSTRQPDGSWRDTLSFRGGSRHYGPPAFYHVSCASTGDALHIVGGTWQGGFA